MVLDAVRDDETHRARAAAERAMQVAGIDVRPAESLTDLRQVREILDQVFKPAPGESEASLDLLVALAHTGQYVVLARDLTAVGLPVLATSLGFFCAPDQATLHSHATAVLETGRSRQVGWALKLHQRSWALERGLNTITWTFDPLIRRNAWFNLAKLGARPTAFEIDFYGVIADAVNAGDETDRLVLAWQLRSEPAASACDGTRLIAPVAGLLADGVPCLLENGPGETPVRGGELPPGTEAALVQLPSDIESLRAADPPLALRWRRELRAVLIDAGQHGLEITEFGPEGWYVLGPASAKQEEAG